MAWSTTSFAGVLVSSMLGFSPRRGVQSHSSDQPGTSVQCRMVDPGHRPGDQQAPAGHQEAVEHEGGHRGGAGSPTHPVTGDTCGSGGCPARRGGPLAAVPLGWPVP